MFVTTTYGDVELKLMSLRDMDMTMRETAKMIEDGYTEEISALVSNIMFGIKSAPFSLDREAILDLDGKTSVKLLEEITKYNDPLGDQEKAQEGA